MAFLVNFAIGFIPNCVIHKCSHLLGMFWMYFPFSISLLLISIMVENMKKNNKGSLLSIICDLISGNVEKVASYKAISWTLSMY